jgi:hypothetical protein
MLLIIDVAVPAAAVENNEAVPPFLNRASSRVFSLSNMLRGDTSRDHSMADVSMRAGFIGGAQEEVVPINVVPSSPLMYGGLGSRNVSTKSVKF